MIPDYSRKIILVDMDAFFTSVEQRDFPAYKNKPLGVGYSTSAGVVMAASYEARKYGIQSGTPVKTAYKLYPSFAIAEPRFEAYKEASDCIQSICKEYSDLVQMVSIDEAFLDVTVNHKNLRSATLLAQELKTQIYKQTHLTSSAGVSYCKFIAKVASDSSKPDGLKVIPPQSAQHFLDTLPIEKFRGIGKVSATVLKSWGIHRGSDLKMLDLADMIRLFGKSGAYFFNVVRGIDPSEIRTRHVRKSVGAERTYFDNLVTDQSIRAEIVDITDEVMGRLININSCGQCVRLKVRLDNFDTKTYSVSLKHGIRNAEELSKVALQLYSQRASTNRPVRLLGLSISNLQPLEEDKDAQLDFFHRNKMTLMESVDLKFT